MNRRTVAGVSTLQLVWLGIWLKFCDALRHVFCFFIYDRLCGGAVPCGADVINWIKIADIDIVDT